MIIYPGGVLSDEEETVLIHGSQGLAAWDVCARWPAGDGALQALLRCRGAGTFAQSVMEMVVRDVAWVPRAAVGAACRTSWQLTYCLSDLGCVSPCALLMDSRGTCSTTVRLTSARACAVS